MQFKELVDAYIEKYKFEIVSRTCDFVKIPSVSLPDSSEKPYGEQCARALDFCDALCREKNLFTQNYDYYCLEASCEPEQSGKRLVVVTHADVVPGGEGSHHDPYAGTVYGDYILGRGCVDDKGPLIATLYALAFFKENNIPLKNDVRLVFGSNEERSMDDIEYYLKKAGQPDWALAADGDFPTENGELGKIQFIISVPKAPGVEYIRSHGSGQGLIQEWCETLIDNKSVAYRKTPAGKDGSGGIANASAHAILHAQQPIFADEHQEQIIRSILSDGKGELMGVAASDEIFGDSLFRIYKVDTVGEEIRLYFDLRLTHFANLQETADKILKFAKENQLNIQISKINKGYYEPADSGIVKLLTDLYNDEMGADEQPDILHSGSTYARLFDHSCGFGAGNRYEVKPFPAGHGSVHGPDEAQNIGVLLNAVKLYILGIKAIDDFWS